MNCQLKRHLIRVPTRILLIYCEKKKLLTVKGPLQARSLKLKVRLVVLPFERTVYVSKLPFEQVPNNSRKRLIEIQGLTVSEIKKTLLESSAKLYLKLKFVGVGYRAFYSEGFQKDLLLMKLGYSHFVYVRVFKNFKVTLFKFTKLFIFGSPFDNVFNIAREIRALKMPEPYKGKGILFFNEKIQLKEGKKV